MKSINLFSFTRIEYDCATKYSNTLTYDTVYTKVREHEFVSLKSLVNILLENGLDVSDFDGFFFSYKIAQIGKEFDLLKVDPGRRVLNIELKSQKVDQKKILAQLKRNEYYLNHLAEKLELYTYVMETDELFFYENGEIKVGSFQVLSRAMQCFTDYEENDLQKYFTAQDYLISPLNTPDKFLQHKYFLTQNQEQMKDQILEHMKKRETEASLIGITGIAGTGKTLLLFELVDVFSRLGRKCAVIYSGVTGEGHRYLNDHWENVKMMEVSSLSADNLSSLFSQYELIAVDETQHIEDDMIRKLVDHAVSKKRKLLFAYDAEQIWSYAEADRNIPQMLHEFPGFHEYRLSEKIRASKELTSFCRNLLNLNDVARGYLSYENVEILYAKDSLQAKSLISFYEEKKGYLFISHKKIEDIFSVMGREFDKVMIMIDEAFIYDDQGRLKDREESAQDYTFWKLLYQGISRVREKLCVIVVGNYENFETILEIKFRMLQKHQYKESKYSMVLSPKTVNKRVNHILGLLRSDVIEKELATKIHDVVIMIKDELTATDFNARVLRNGVHLLEYILLEETLPQELCEELREIKEWCFRLEE